MAPFRPLLPTARAAPLFPRGPLSRSQRRIAPTSAIPIISAKPAIAASSRSGLPRRGLDPNLIWNQQQQQRQLKLKQQQRKSPPPLLLLAAGGLLPLAAEYTFAGITAPTVIWGTLAAYVAVFAAWRVPSATWYYRVMTPHFTCSYYETVHLRRPWRLHTLLTSAYSHHGGFHLAANSLGLMAVAPPLLENYYLSAPTVDNPAAPLAIAEPILTQPGFLAFYLSAAALSSMGGWIIEAALAVPGAGGADARRLRLWHALVQRPASLGASGALYACFGATAVLFPAMEFYLLPIPFVVFSAGWLLAVLPLFDAAGLAYNRANIYSGKSSPVGHGAHLAGLVVGVVFALFVENRWDRTEQREREEEAERRRKNGWW